MKKKINYKLLLISIIIVAFWFNRFFLNNLLRKIVGVDQFRYRVGVIVKPSRKLRRTGNVKDISF